MTLAADLRLRLGALELDASLQVASGEIVAVVGPNGAGKTTLLRALAGLVPLGGGRVELEGRTWEDPSRGLRVPPERRPVGVVFQDRLLFPHLSVVDNVAFGLRARGMRRRAAHSRAMDWLERVDLAGVARARPKALSGGQAQRVALARALAPAPALLLLDEPLAALDVEARRSIRHQLRIHLEAFRGPCLLVTHDPLDAATLAGRLAVLESGRVTQSGTVEEVTRRPRTDWIAELAGVNLYRGWARDGRVEFGTGAALVAPERVDGEVFAVIRPQAVALHRSRPHGTPRNVWSGHVATVDGRGDRMRVRVDGVLPIVAEVTPAAVAELDLGRGGPVWVSVKATEVDLYAV